MARVVRFRQRILGTGPATVTGLGANQASADNRLKENVAR